MCSWTPSKVDRIVTTDEDPVINNEPRTHLRGNGSGQCVRGLLAVGGGGSLRLLSDWLLCTCRSTLLFRSSSVVMMFHCWGKKKAQKSKQSRLRCQSLIGKSSILGTWVKNTSNFSSVARVVFIKLENTVGWGDFCCSNQVPNHSPPPLDLLT